MRKVVPFNQDRYYGWHRIVATPIHGIRNLFMTDTTWGRSKYWIGAAGMDFTCR